MKSILFCFIFFLSISAHAQSLCDSLTLSADTIYITQPQDSVITFALNCSAVTGDVFAYATCSFLFSDTTNININHQWVLPGFNWGPWTYSFLSIEIIYNNLAIPPNTVINALFETDAISALSCYLPVVFVVNSTTGIEENNHDEQFTVFPNPVSNELNLFFSEDASAEVKIYNMLGETDWQAKTKGKEIKIDVSNLQDGIYILEVTRKNKITRKKFVNQ